MTKQSFPTSISTTPVSKSLEERLNRHPELRTKIESLLSVVENASNSKFKV
jgi:hypothetical protein